MGFNFAGIAINKNVKEEISVLEQLLGKKLTLTDEIYFEDAMSYHKEDNDCDVYFNQNGTLVFLSEPIANSLKNASKGMKVLQFAVSETSMVFVLELSENEETIREIQEFEGERMFDEGEKFENESDEDEGFEVVLKSIKYIVDEDFWTIEPDAKSFRYKMS
jgi:hypothetical protein